ncbi:three-helix bundle dimerization domain-containing protein [Streptomyces sp. NPDC058287]|uniref:three-helix bundle dimerization domain-containing protein n=1 Tax=unclassified Streptomyces TaxID=2593676 RepID=UPI0036F0BBA4
MEQAEPEVPPDPPPVVPPAEDLAVHDMVGRLREAWPTVAENVVETAVRSAYDSFRQARVRAYLPIWSNAGLGGRSARLPAATPSGRENYGRVRKWWVRNWWVISDERAQRITEFTEPPRVEPGSKVRPGRDFGHGPRDRAGPTPDPPVEGRRVSAHRRAGALVR